MCSLLQVNVLYLDGVGCVLDEMTSSGPSWKFQFCESLTESVLFNVEWVGLYVFWAEFGITPDGVELLEFHAWLIQG